MVNDVSDIYFENVSKKRSIIFRIFRELFVRFVRSICFHQTACVAAIFLVRKSSKSEPSSRIFDCLKIFNFWPCIIYFSHNYREMPSPKISGDDDDRRRLRLCRRRCHDTDDVHSKVFQILAHVDAIDLVRKSSKSELSSRFFGRSGF